MHCELSFVTTLHGKNEADCENIEEMVEIRAGAPDPRFVWYVRRIVHDAGHYDVRFQLV